MRSSDTQIYRDTESMSVSTERLVEIMQGRAKPLPKMALGKVFEMRSSSVAYSNLSVYNVC